MYRKPPKRVLYAFAVSIRLEKPCLGGLCTEKTETVFAPSDVCPLLSSSSGLVPLRGICY